MNYKILLVDDDKDLLQMLSSYFELKGLFYIIGKSAIWRTAKENIP